MKATNKTVFLLAITLLTLVTSASFTHSEDTPSAFTTDPIAGVGHSSLLNPDGEEINPLPEFVLKAQRFYLGSLLQQANEQQRADFKALQERLSDMQGLNQHEQILVNSTLITRLIEAVNPSDANDLSVKNASLQQRIVPITLSEQGVIDVGDAPISKAVIDQLSLEGLLLAAIVQQVPSDEILKARDAYIEECKAAGVPIPPDFGKTCPSGDPCWERQPNPLPFVFISPGKTAEVFVYRSATPRGVCIALPRSSGTTIELLGVICQGNDTSRTCFWDNQRNKRSYDIPKAPPQNPKTETTDVPLREGFAGGAELFGGTGGPCTDCHAGENAFIVHPGTPLDLGDAILRPNNWYKPLVDPRWPQNPGPTNALAGNALCLTCHGQTSGRQFPAVSTELKGYCETILPQAFRLTMPPGAPGNSAFRGQFNDLIAACQQPPFLIGQLVNVSGRITFLRVNEVGDLFGVPGDDISAEVIIQLDSIPDLFFGLQLRRDQNLLTRRAIFKNLKTAFEDNIPVAIDYRRKSAHIGTIERVWVNK